MRSLFSTLAFIMTHIFVLAHLNRFVDGPLCSILPDVLSASKQIVRLFKRSSSVIEGHNLRKEIITQLRHVCHSYKQLALDMIHSESWASVHQDWRLLLASVNIMQLSLLVGCDDSTAQKSFSASFLRAAFALIDEALLLGDGSLAPLLHAAAEWVTTRIPPHTFPPKRITVEWTVPNRKGAGERDGGTEPAATDLLECKPCPENTTSQKLHPTDTLDNVTDTAAADDLAQPTVKRQTLLRPTISHASLPLSAHPPSPRPVPPATRLSFPLRRAHRPPLGVRAYVDNVNTNSTVEATLRMSNDCLSVSLCSSFFFSCVFRSSFPIAGVSCRAFAEGRASGNCGGD